MSLIKANAVQVGQSPTATQNFTLAVPSSPDGTIKLARGNAGATTQDVLSVDASGNINGLVKATGSSTTARSLANRFADVVNVKDFGAVGDGVTDDTVAIQAAINSINLLNGGCVYFPNGNYKITSTITILGANIQLHGASPSTEYGSIVNNYASTRIVWGNTVNDSSIYMFSIGDITQGSAVTRRVSFKDIAIDGQDYVSGIMSTWSPEMIIEGVSFNQLHLAHYCYSSLGYGRNYSNTWRDCYFHDFKECAIKIDEDGHRTNILQCSFSSSTSVPPNIIRIGDVGFSTLINIQGCNFEPLGDDGTGQINWIDARRTRGLNVVSNYFEVPNNTSIKSCIRLGANADSDESANGNFIAGNRMVIRSTAPDYATGKNAIFVRDASGVVITGNIFEAYNGDIVKIDTLSQNDVKDVHYIGNYDAGSSTPITYLNQNVDTVFNRYTRAGKFGTDVIFGDSIYVPDSGNFIKLLNSNNAGVQLSPYTPTIGTSNAAFRPLSDNLQRLGSSIFRWSEVYAGTGTINTSDENQKEQIESIPKEWLDAWGDVEFYRYKFKDSVAVKNDNARWHIGVIAQRVKLSFENKGIDPFSIGLLCYDEEDGKQTYGIRYEEALALECAYLRSKIK
jgi:hypothetical protein